MIDLHMHTIFSDGTDSVEEILKKAKKANLEIISITDH
ncbi:MAG TPA: PHP domain-containing protein, partial [Candidatus Coprovivens excrementavium]|nr:PHP domain-containing protein [Candidatus Coprovivens excrementavium]